MRSSFAYSGSDTYRPGGAWFICDVCSQRFRRTQLLVRWDNLRVDRKCLDPRPPQMAVPDVYPEGIPFPDTRAPQDRPDRLEDDTSLQSVTGGFALQNGALYPNGQTQQPGALSPQPLQETTGDVDARTVLGTDSGLYLVTENGNELEITTLGVPYGPAVLADDVTFITGYVTFDAAINPPVWPIAPGPTGVPGGPAP